MDIRGGVVVVKLDCIRESDTLRQPIDHQAVVDAWPLVGWAEHIERLS
jgi:hypothetical protein